MCFDEGKKRLFFIDDQGSEGIPYQALAIKSIIFRVQALF